MKHAFAFTALLILCGTAMAQNYAMTFSPKSGTDSVLYIARHYRDEVQLVDSTARTARSGNYVFAGRRQWQRGVYALVRQDRKTVLTDFLVDDSRVFTISGDSSMSAASIKVKGSAANQIMFEYKAKQDWASKRADSLRKAGNDAAIDELGTHMDEWQKQIESRAGDNLYLRLVSLTEPARVPDSIVDKARYYRIHYWDPLFADNRREFNALHTQLLYSPQLFSKMNYFFFGMLYHADADTIKLELDRLMARIGDDTAMARFVLQFIEPRYFRSTRNVGWDAVWCHIASEYILKGRCPWMRESEIYLARQNYNRIRQSIIGAHGQELIMLDTTQIDSPEHWFSSHRLPQKYVILWFWDPDCHHCQEQSEALKTLYDSLMTAPDRRFEVYAVGYESDVPKWKKYVRQHGFNWINVGGPNVNIDYQEAYNVHGAPTMIILNERRDIIMNKVLPAKSLLQFLDNYEKRSKGVKE
jgi:hypothetical protein